MTQLMIPQRQTIRRGVTLMEVLASVFVICIGLMGVLSVIPFGAFQVSKAREAEFTSNMLRNAEEELATKEIIKPERWIPVVGTLLEDGTSFNGICLSAGNTPIFNRADDADKRLNCQHFLMLDPASTTEVANSHHIYRIGANFKSMKPDILKEWMKGQDDLVYSVYKEQRSDFAGQHNKVLSSGHFTWFAMFRPQFNCNDTTHTHGTSNVPWNEVSELSDTPVDLIGCYNRGAEESIAVTPSPTNPVHYLNNSLKVELPNMPVEVDVTKTKYVFLSWYNGGNPANVSDGAWYKVVNVMNGNQLFLTFADGTPYPAANLPFEVLLIEGTLYHKRVTVPLRDPS